MGVRITEREGAVGQPELQPRPRRNDNRGGTDDSPPHSAHVVLIGRQRSST
jgi:hypothetical protein